MKKQIITGATVIACAALCANLWQRSAEVEQLPAEPTKAAVCAETETQPEEAPYIFISADTPAPESEAVAESEPQKTEVTAEKEPEKPAPTQATSQPKPSPTPSEPHMGDTCVVDGEKQSYFLGFGWIKDESGENAGTVAEDMYENGHKVGIIGGSTTVDGGGDINVQVGVMGGGEAAPHETAAAPAEQTAPTGNVIYTELQPSVTKDSTPPSYKPNGEPTNP